MKNNSIFRLIFAYAIAASITFSFSSCGDDNDGDGDDPGKTVLQIAADGADFTLLEAAVVRANLTKELSDPKAQLTVFAPTDAAFRAAGFATEDAIKAADPAVLKGILLYHVLGSEVKAAAVPKGPNTAVTTLNGASVYATSNANGVFINGIKVATADVDASNGVVHVINKVILPPAGNIVATATAAKFTLLLAAVNYVDTKLGLTGSSSIAGLLSGPGPLTVFAPTDAAFIAALDGADRSTKNGKIEPAELDAVGAETIAAILQLHVIGARVYSSDLTEGAKPATLNTKSEIVISLTGPTVKGKGNATAAKITATDITTTNGVIHVIDTVLLP